VATPHRGRPAGQDEEGGLEGVLGRVRLAQQAPAQAQHHRPVASHEGLEGPLVAPADEAIEQLRVARRARPGGAGQAAEVVQELGGAGHPSASLGGVGDLL
jgi:hypothetical protein